MAKLKVNGNIKEFTPNEFPSLLSDLISHLNLEKVSIIAEVEGTIIRKDKFDQTELKDGMSIELVKFVGGG